VFLIMKNILLIVKLQRATQKCPEGRKVELNYVVLLSTDLNIGTLGP
jgi:hypothetical protein